MTSSYLQSWSRTMESLASLWYSRVDARYTAARKAQREQHFNNRVLEGSNPETAEVGKDRVHSPRADKLKNQMTSKAKSRLVR
jgi:hypothetical protein